MNLSRRSLALTAAALLAGVLCGAVPLAAQQPASTPSPDLAGIAHVALRVRDLDASIAFYEKLGFVKAFDLSRDGKVYEAFIKINDRQFIELYPVDAKNTQVGFLHLCFEGNDLNAVHDYYVAKGLSPIAVRTAGAGNLLFTMPGPLTPQGPQNMEYTQYMPGSLHSKDFGQHLGADRISDMLSSVTIAAEDKAAARSFYLDKLGFVAASDALGLPGKANGNFIKLVPAPSLGMKARITFFSPAKSLVAEARKHHVNFTKEGTTLVILDPDGNEVLLAPSNNVTL